MSVNEMPNPGFGSFGFSLSNFTRFSPPRALRTLSREIPLGLSVFACFATVRLGITNFLSCIAGGGGGGSRGGGGGGGAATMTGVTEGICCFEIGSVILWSFLDFGFVRETFAGLVLMRICCDFSLFCNFLFFFSRFLYSFSNFSTRS